MSDAPNYRFHCQIIDETTGEVVIVDYCSLTSIDPFGGCESVDMHVASMLRAFQRTARGEHERDRVDATTLAQRAVATSRENAKFVNEAAARIRAKVANSKEPAR